MRAALPLRGQQHEDSPAHAVDDVSRISGAMDSVCGRQMKLLIGEWPPVERRPCVNCARETGLPTEELVSA